MTTSFKNDAAFLRYADLEDLLSKAVDWIKDNMEPDDVFTKEQLDRWAAHNYECDLDHVEDEP